MRLGKTSGATALALLFALLAGCGDSEPIDGAGGGAGPTATPGPSPSPSPSPSDAGMSLGSYLHDLSPRLDGVSYDNATLEHYSIPTSDGTVLDAWVRRPPGEVGQPLVMVISPYYGGGDPSLSPLGDPSTSFGQYLIPYGYAVGFMSVGGTGNSGGCFRDGGPIERQQLYDAVDYLSKQTWSNGAVASIGVSYDGTTSNELFVQPPPGLKTVVPMEAISDYYRYSFNNGMRRGTNSLFTTYYYVVVGVPPVGLEGGVGPTEPASYVTALSGEPCAEQLAIQQESVNGFQSRDKTPFWDERDAVALVDASPELPRPPMFYISGYQDANVDMLMAEGYLDAVKRTGVPLHIWLGQWVHAYPQGSSACEDKAPCRGDFWEQALLAWFDQWLKDRETGILDAPMVQTQADDGVWRHETAWPPGGVTTEDLHLDTQGGLVRAPASGTATYRDINGDTLVTVLEADEPLEFVSAPLVAPLRLTGAPRFESEMTADAASAGVVLTLIERRADGTQRWLNFGALSLNHAASLAQSDSDISGKALPVAFDLFALDNVVAAGSQLVLVVGGQVSTQAHETAGDSANLQNGGPNLAPSGVGANVTLDLAKTRLRLPVNRGGAVETLSWLTP